MEYYTLAKHVHMSAAVLSLLGFLIRGYWMISGSLMLKTKPVKILPHIVDTVLLVAAIYLVAITQLYPFSVNWVTAKVLLLVVYIVAGVFALKRGKTKQTRLIAFFIGVITIFAIFALAAMKPALNF